MSWKGPFGGVGPRMQCGVLRAFERFRAGVLSSVRGRILSLEGVAFRVKGLGK